MEAANLKKELDSVQSSLAYASKQLDSERASGEGSALTNCHTHHSFSPALLTG